MTEEEKHKHKAELNRARVKKYLEKHPKKNFKVLLEPERFDELTEALEERNTTKKQFLEQAIDRFLKGE